MYVRGVDVWSDAATNGVISSFIFWGTNNKGKNNKYFFNSGYI